MRLNVRAMDYPELRMCEDPDGDPKIQGYRRNCCDKEPETVKWIEDYVKDGDTVWDVGANVGSYSLIAAKRNPRSTVVAIEPVYTSFYFLGLNRLINDLHNIVPFFGALTRYSGITSFGLGPSQDAIGGAGHPGIMSGDSRYKVFGINGALLGQMIGFPRHIKIDVDGAEFEVLAGLSLSRWDSLKSMIIEVETERIGELTTLLSQHDFKPQPTLPHKFAGVSNIIFAR